MVVYVIGLRVEDGIILQRGLTLSEEKAQTFIDIMNKVCSHDEEYIMVPYEVTEDRIKLLEVGLLEEGF